MNKRRVFGIVFFVFVLARVHALDVIFRFDDFKLIDDDFQNQLIEVFAEEQVPVLLAILPFNPDTTRVFVDGPHLDRVRELHGQGILQIGLHGFSHTGNKYDGEFPLLNYEEQRFRLELGSHFLDSVFGTHIHIFIPPWNKYDQNTLDILADLGFDAISSDLTRKKGCVITDSRFQYYPMTAPRTFIFRDVIACNSAREGLVVWMLHRYDFPDEVTLEEMHAILKEVKANTDLRIVTMDELLARDSSFDGERMQANLTRPLLTKILYTRPIILPTDEARRLQVYDLLLWLMVVAGIACVGLCFVGKQKRNYLIAQSAIVVLTGFQIWYQWIMPRMGIIILLLAAMAVIVLFLIIKRRSVSNG